MNCSYHKYADDTELSSSATVDNFDHAVKNVQSCIENVMSWMNSNKLKLNPDKTEVMAVGSIWSPLGSIGISSVDISNSSVNFQNTCRYLGVLLDNRLSLNKQVSNICSTCHYEIRRISCIRNILTQSAAAKLMSALVISRLDYCNSLLASATQGQIDRLQKVQNDAARAVMKRRRRHHVTPLLRELHWLPIAYRYRFKIATFVYKHFEGSLPSYLSESLDSRCYSKEVRSSSVKRLNPPRKANLKTVGGRSFRQIAPIIWNDLPIDLRAAKSLPAFKRNLKTLMFREHFGP